MNEKRAAAEAGSPFGRPLFRWLVLAMPACFLGFLIFRYGVNTPWADQWDGMSELFAKAQAGTLRLSDFFAFHNEHRHFFPRLIQFALARLTHWDICAELFVIWGLLCVCSLNLNRLVWRTGFRKSRSRDWLLLASNVLLFTPLQWENLLWGFQIGFLLPLATMTACILLATVLPRPFDFLTTLALGVVTTFSIASGAAVWFLTAPLLFLLPNKSNKGREAIWWVIWMTTAVASVVIYFRGFVPPDAHPSEAHALTHPLAALQFLLAYLGNPFSCGTPLAAPTLAQLVGASLLVVLAACAVYLWRGRKHSPLRAQALPWLALTGIALSNALLTTIGRAGFGIAGALAPRYVSFAIMLPIGLLFLVAVILRDWQARTISGTRVTTARSALLGYATAISLLLLAATVHGLGYWPRLQHRRLLGKSAILFSQVLDQSEPLRHYVHWAGAAWRERINLLDRIGYLHPALVRSLDIRQIAADTAGETMGEFANFGRQANGELGANGWAVLPSAHRVADSVLLAYENAQGEWIVFDRVDVGLALPAISERFGDSTYLHAGWRKSWKPSELPLGAQQFGAWAFDAETRQAFPIGTIKL